MTTFTFDTSGTVRRPGFARPLAWSDLDAAEKHRVATAAARYWVSLGEDVTEAMAHLGHTVKFSDFTPRALAKVMSTDLPVKLALNAGDLDLADAS